MFTSDYITVVSELRDCETFDEISSTVPNVFLSNFSVLPVKDNSFKSTFIDLMIDIECPV